MTQKNYLLLTLLLVNACSLGFTQNKNSMIERVVSETTLDNGKILTVGFKHPGSGSNADCSDVNDEVKSWTASQLKGIVNFGGGYGDLKDDAIAYVNAHPNDKINYVYLDIPNTMDMGNPMMGIPMGDAHIRYYSCKNPPSKHSNPFKD